MFLSLKTIRFRSLLGKMYVVNRIVRTICNGLRQCVLVQYVQMLQLISYIYNRVHYYYHFTFTGARSKGWFSKEGWRQSATETCNGICGEDCRPLAYVAIIEYLFCIVPTKIGRLTLSAFLFWKWCKPRVVYAIV